MNLSWRQFGHQTFLNIQIMVQANEIFANAMFGAGLTKIDPFSAGNYFCRNDGETRGTEALCQPEKSVVAQFHFFSPFAARDGG